MVISMYFKQGIRLGLGVARLLSVGSNSIFTWANAEIGAYTRDSMFKPHTSNYIKQQLSLFKKKSIPAKVVQLPKGMILTGPLNSNDIVLGSQAVYPGDKLSLSLREITNIQETSPALSKFELKEDLQCIESLGDNQQKVYYVHHTKLKPGELIPSTDLINPGLSI